jgi:hypothetical protein
VKKRRISIIITSAALWATVCLAYAIQVTDPDIAAVWLFDEDEKDRVTDLSASKHVGQIHDNVVWGEDGKFGGALSFEGNTSWIEVPDHPSLQFENGQDFTVAAYVKTEMSSGSPPMIVAKNYQPAEVRPWYALYYANQSKDLDGHVSFFLRDQAGNNFHIASASTINDNDWHHVAGTRKGDTIKLYVDGVAEAEMGGADFDVGTNAAPLHINGHLDRWLVGVFDEIILVRRALNDSEIEALARDGISDMFLSVSPKDKLSATWASIKKQ